VAWHLTDSRQVTRKMQQKFSPCRYTDLQSLAAPRHEVLSSNVLSIKPLDDNCGCAAATVADRCAPNSCIVVLEDLVQRPNNPRPAHPYRVAQRDCAAKDVDLRIVQVEQPHICQRNLRACVQREKRRRDDTLLHRLGASRRTAQYLRRADANNNSNVPR